MAPKDIALFPTLTTVMAGFSGQPDVRLPLSPADYLQSQVAPGTDVVETALVLTGPGVSAATFNSNTFATGVAAALSVREPAELGNWVTG
jgi:hypothetical protein